MQELSNYKITASIVLHNEKIEILSKAIESFLSISLSKKLYLVDNSPSDTFREKFKDPTIEYIFVGKNIGYGTGHNLVLDRIKNNSMYHLILNPDVEFNPIAILNMIQQLEENDVLAMIAPKVIFPNGRHQYSCRRYPKALELIVRRLTFLDFLFKPLIAKGKYLDKDLTKSFYGDYLTGCFQLYRTEDFVNIGGFDERYFLYMEDVDICRKIDEIGKKKLYYPSVQITHILKKESSKNIRLFFTHLNSSIKYFKKWGF